MYRPAHTALYRALLDHPPSPELTTADRTMALVRDAGAHAAGITPVYAHTLMAACPHPRNALVYARMIVEAADHRLVREHAVRLGQVAAADHARDGLADTLTHHRRLHRVLDDLHHRRPDPDPDLATPTHPVRTPDVDPEPPRPRDLDDERALIGALILDPAPTRTLGRWLTPADFADAAHAALYRCLHALVARGEPVDSLTLAWEAQHRGAFAGGGPGPELVVEIAASGVPADIDYRARRVLRARILRTAASAAAAVGTHAGNPTLSATRLVTAARTTLAPLDDALARRHHAIAATPATTDTNTSPTVARSRTGNAARPATGPEPTSPTAAQGHRTGRRP